MTTTEATLQALDPVHKPEDDKGALTHVPHAERQPEEPNVKEAIHQTTDKLKESAGELVSKTRKTARRRADAFLQDTSVKARDLEKSTYEAAEKLQGTQPEYLANGALYVSDQIGGVADYLENKDSEKIIQDAQAVVRNHPGAVLGGMLLAGFVVGRFLKSSNRSNANNPETPETEPLA